MIRLSATNACYVTNSTVDAIKPADLLKALELVREWCECSLYNYTLSNMLAISLVLFTCDSQFSCVSFTL